MVYGCKSAPPVSVVDLVERFRFTDAGQAVSLIDLGTPDAETHLRDGWSVPGLLPSGESVAWAVARRARVQFAIDEPFDGRLLVHCTLAAPDAPRAVAVTVTLNGHRLGVLRVQRELAMHALALPSHLQQRGINVLEITNPFLTELPRNRERARARAVAVDWLWLEGMNEAPRPFLREATAEEPPALVLPAGTGIDFFVRVPRAAELSLRVHPHEAREAVLRIAWHMDGAGERILRERVVSSRVVRLPLDAQAGEPIRLSLAVEGGGALALVEPSILGAADDTTEALEGRALPGTPPVLLYIADTLRADHVGHLGYGRPTSPHIDAFAADGISFTRVVAQSSWTKPATASILTGLNAPAHGAVSLGAILRAGPATLAELLKERGYRTAAFVTNVNVRGELGFARGFDDYTYLAEDEHRPTLHVPIEEVNESVFRWLAVHREEPFFLYVHASDPHAPYRPPPRVAARLPAPAPDSALAAVAEPLHELVRNPAARTSQNVAYLRGLYDGDVAALDEGFGALVAHLKSLGLYERTVIVFTADHGEEFNDHGGFEHGRTLFRDQLEVPLVFRLPGDQPRGMRVDALARQIDIMPTVLALLGAAIPGAVQGRPLPPIGAASGPAGMEAVSQTNLGRAGLMALTTTDWKIVHTVGPQRETFEVYDLRTDRGESRNLAAERPVLLGYGRQTLTRWAVTMPRSQLGDRADVETIDEETARRLRALGYVDH